MNKEKKATAPDVYGWVKDQTRMIPVVVMILAGTGILVWNVYAKDKVQEIVKADTAQIWTEVIKLKKDVKTNKKNIKKIKFGNIQMLYLMKKIAGKKAVKEMEEDTEMFKPENDLDID